MYIGGWVGSCWRKGEWSGVETHLNSTIHKDLQISAGFIFTKLHFLSFSGDNLPSYRACSQLLSSVSGYQYTRKAWRKEGLDLLLDPNFFQMDGRSLAYWRVVVDNLFTHDRTTFKDLMSKQFVYGMIML